MMMMSPVDVAVHVGLPVTHVYHHVPGQTRLTRGGVRHAPRALVVDVADPGVGEVTLGSGAAEVGGGGRGLGDVEVGVPVWSSDTEQRVQSRGPADKLV